MTQGRLQSTVAEYRAQLLAREAQAEQALQHAYGHTLAAIQPKLDALYQEIHQKQTNGEEVPLSWLYEQRRLATIQQIVTNQINHFAALAQTTAGHLQRQGVSLGQASAQDQLDATVPAGVAWSFGVPSHAALVNLVGATQAGSPLADLFTGFGEEAASNVGKALISGLMNGDNPRTVAAQVQQALDVPRWRALTIARNEMLRAYKSAAVTNYQANSDVVGQWRWQADKSPRTCAACLAMDGSLHDLSETLDSHVQCRCAPVPVTKSWADILGPLGIDTSDIPDASIVNSDYETGAQWLDSQDEATQRAILGNAKYDAYTNGDITLSDLVGTKSDPNWGNSIYERSLADALTAASSGGSSDSSTQNDTPQQPVVLAPTNDAVFPDGLDAQNAFLKQQQADARAALTADERNSIKEYSYLNYRDINSSLRDPSSLDPSDQQWVTEEIAHLDSAVAKGAAPVDMTVYRGVEAYGGTLDYFAQNVGKVVQDNAFGSTSLNVETASRFADDGGGIITIRIPQGYPGLYLGPLSGYELNNNLTPEYEYLLPRGTKFAVIDYVPATADAKAHFIFEVLP